MTARRRHSRVSVAAFAALLVLALCGCEDRSRVSALEAELETCHEECEARVAAWRDALEEANGTIEELNSEIENAQLSSATTYGEMSEALDGLEAGSTTDAPE